jgi:hypothetical protein
MIQQFTGFLTRVMRLRKDGEHEEALALLFDNYGRLAGLPGSLVHALSEDDLINMMQSQGRLEPERCLGLAELLREEAHVYDDLQQFDESYPRYVKALRLYIEAVAEDEQLADGTVPGLDDVIVQLQGLDLPAPSVIRLAQYLERSGRFDDAENFLVQSANREDGYGIPPREVAAFYTRLLEKPDSELIVGGLTRDEVRDGLSRLVP